MIIERLKRAGFLGMNRRNFEYVQGLNPRHLYPLVDDKVRTKKFCAEAGVPTPETLAVVTHLHEIPNLEERLESEDSFVIKPARGSQGNGILVATERNGQDWQKSSGKVITRDDMRFRIAEIISGLYSLSGQPDSALVEECLTVHPALTDVVHGGVPDIRLIVYRSHPVMAMLRLPTRAADGRANLHQGAVGVGIALNGGKPVSAICDSRTIDRHPDTKTPIDSIRIPDFDTLLRVATQAGAQSGLGYVGVDLVLDARRGPVILELNARPGLGIQLANSAGLIKRFRLLDELAQPNASLEERIALSQRVETECEV